MKKELIKSIFGILVLYLIQFLLLPLIINKMGNEIWVAFFLSTILCSVIGIIFLSDKLYCWLISDIVYLILMFLYHPEGAYGIGMRGLDLGAEAQSYYNRADAWFVIIILFICAIIIQVLIWGIVKITRKLLVKKSEKDVKYK